jgi:hypothetical protein
MNSFATYKRFSAQSKIGLRLRFEYLNGEQWEELLSSQGHDPKQLEFDVRHHVAWRLDAPHRLILQLTIEDKEERDELLSIYPGNLIATVSARSGLIRHSTSVGFSGERCKLELTLPAGSLADKLEFRCAISSSPSSKGLLLWEENARSISMVGRLAKFPVEVRHFEDEWKWMEICFPEQDLADADLQLEVGEAFRLQVDDRKPGWQQLRACIQSNDKDIQAAGFSQLSGLVLLSIAEWIWQSADSEQAQEIQEGQSGGGQFQEKTLGYILHLLLTSKLAGASLLNNSLPFASVVQMGNVINKDRNEDTSRIV